MLWEVIGSLLLFGGGFLIGGTVGTKAVRASVFRDVRRVIAIHIRSHEGQVFGQEHPAAIGSLRDLATDLHMLQIGRMKLVQTDTWELRV